MSFVDTIKAHWVPIVIGGGVATVGIWYYESHKSSSAGTTATPTGATSTPTPSGTGGGGGGQLSGILSTLDSDINALTSAITAAPAPSTVPAGATGATGATGPVGPAPVVAPLTTPTPGPTIVPSLATTIAQANSGVVNGVPVPGMASVVSNLSANPASVTAAIASTDLYTPTVASAGNQAAAAALAAAQWAQSGVPAPAPFISSGQAATNAAGTAKAPSAAKVPASQNQAGANPSGQGVHY